MYYENQTDTYLSSSKKMFGNIKADQYLVLNINLLYSNIDPVLSFLLRVILLPNKHVGIYFQSSSLLHLNDL